MTDLNAALMRHFLDIPVAAKRGLPGQNEHQRGSCRSRAALTKTGVCSEQESVAVGLEVGHGGSAYFKPIQASYGIDLKARG